MGFSMTAGVTVAHHCHASHMRLARQTRGWPAGGSALTGGLEQASAGHVDAPFTAVRLVAQKQ